MVRRWTTRILLRGVLVGMLATTACSGTPNGGASTDGGTTGQSDGGTSSDGGTTTTTSQPCQQATVIDHLPACSQASNAPPVVVPQGCVPKVDGTLYAEEWSDATCVEIPADIPAADNGGVSYPFEIYLKYANGMVYVAVSGYAFATTLDLVLDPDNMDSMADELRVQYEDSGPDPTYMVYQGNAWTNATGSPGGIFSQYGGGFPYFTVEYEIPFAALNISAGQPHTFRLGVAHMGTWPDASITHFVDEANQWGAVSGAANWNSPKLP